MMVRVELAYNANTIVRKLDRQDWLELTEVWGLELPTWPESLVITEDNEKEHPGHNWYKYGSDIICDDQTDLPLLRKHRVPHTVKAYKNTYKAVTPIDPENPDAGLQAIHVHIPNVGLLAMNEVTWMEDACTEDLQRKIDEGWRMIAVCPPNGTRRPDYILGRSVTKRNT